MCGRQTNTLSWAQIRELLTFGGIQAEFGDFDPNEARFNLAPGQQHYVVTARDATLWALPARWGLIPSWAKDKSIASKTFNARAETVREKPSFRDAFAKGRCLVPASGYYEWNGAKGQRQPWWIHPKEEIPLFFAGLTELWQPRDGGEPLRSYSVVTRPSEGQLQELHPRMPLILDESAWESWILGDAAATDPMQLPAIVDSLELRPVSTRVNSVENDDAQLIEAMPPEQGSLF